MKIILEIIQETKIEVLQALRSEADETIIFDLYKQLKILRGK